MCFATQKVGSPKRTSRTRLTSAHNLKKHLSKEDLNCSVASQRVESAQRGKATLASLSSPKISPEVSEVSEVSEVWIRDGEISTIG